MVNELRDQTPCDSGVPVQVAGDPEKRIYEERKKTGIPIRPVDVKFYMQAAVDYGIMLQITDKA